MRQFNLVVALCCSLTIAAQASQKSPVDAFAAIEKWHGTFSINVRRDRTFPYAGQSIKLLDEETVNGSFTLVRTDLEGGRVWTTEEGSIGGGVHVQNRSETTIPGAQAKATYIRTTHGSGSLGAILEGSKCGTFSLSVSGNKYTVSGSGSAMVKEKNWAEIPGLAGKGEGMGDLLQGLGDSEGESIYNVSAHGEQTLPKTVGTLSGSSREEEGEGGGTVLFQWTVSPGAPEKGELVLAPVDQKAYEAWLPAPVDDPKLLPKGTRLAFRADLKPEKGKKVTPQGRIDFYLTDVSDNPGTCCNYPKAPPAMDDLRFAPQKDQANDIVIVDSKHAHTKNANVTSATVLVEATDTGAYGKLSAVAEDLGLKGKVEKTQKTFLSIPLDENDNHVADQWEKDNQVFGKDGAWDEDPEPADQATTGDGISLYKEYRGFMVVSANGKLEFIRTNPRKKEIFVLDESGIFNAGLWEGASGITALRLNRDLIKGTESGAQETQRLKQQTNNWKDRDNADGNREDKIVDFNSAKSNPGGHKYVITILKDEINDEVPTFGCRVDIPKAAPAGHWSPVLVFFPNRIANKVRHVFIDSTLKKAAAGEAEFLKDFQDAGIGLPEVKSAWDSVVAGRIAAGSGGEASGVMRFISRLKELTVIHELGHGVGILGHRDYGKVSPTGGRDPEFDGGDKTCPMCYFGDNDNRHATMETLQGNDTGTLLRNRSRFCNSARFFCWKEINVKDLD